VERQIENSEIVRRGARDGPWCIPCRNDGYSLPGGGTGERGGRWKRAAVGGLRLQVTSPAPWRCWKQPRNPRRYTSARDIASSLSRVNRWWFARPHLRS
jgi:hypothetical protein